MTGTRERRTLYRLGGRSRSGLPGPVVTLPSLVARHRATTYDAAPIVAVLDRLPDQVRHHPDVLAVRALIGAAPVPTAPALDRREAAAVSWLLGQTGWHGPSVLTPEEETACARGWGMPCPGGDHTDGCPVAAGWEHVAVGRLWSYTHGDAGSDPMLAADQPHPFTTAGLLGPWPRCWPRHLHGWYRQTLPPP